MMLMLLIKRTVRMHHHGAVLDRVIFQSAPVPRRGSDVGLFFVQGNRTLPPWPSVMTPKSTMYRAEPSGKNERRWAVPIHRRRFWRPVR